MMELNARDSGCRARNAAAFRELDGRFLGGFFKGWAIPVGAELPLGFAADGVIAGVVRCAWQIVHQVFLTRVG